MTSLNVRATFRVDEFRRLRADCDQTEFRGVGQSQAKPPDLAKRDCGTAEIGPVVVAAPS